MKDGAQIGAPYISEKATLSEGGMSLELFAACCGGLWRVICDAAGQGRLIDLMRNGDQKMSAVRARACIRHAPCMRL